MSNEKTETNTAEGQVVEDNLPKDHPAMVNGEFHTALQEQSAPLVDHLGRAPAGETVGVMELKQKEVEAVVYLNQKLDNLQKYVDGLLDELNKREEKVIQDGRSAVDNIAGVVRRELARLK